MQKWEYIVLTGLHIGLDTSVGSRDKVAVGEINGEPQHRLELYQALNELGEQGWELMNMQSLDHRWLCCILKRPKP